MNTTIRTKRKTLPLIHVQSHHTMCLVEVKREDESYPLFVDEKNTAGSSYAHVYEVRNWDVDGVIFMYVCTGYSRSKKEVHVFYPNGAMWSSFGKTIEDAINGAQRDGWMYTR